MIDEQRTLEIYGYISDELKLQSGKLIIRVCDECGKYDEIIYSSYNRNKNPDLCNSCSCKGEKNSSWKGGLVTLTCQICGNEFEVIPSLKNQKFCSDKCHSKWRSENLSGENSPCWKGGLITLICEICGNKFEVAQANKNQKCCSRKCQGKWHSKNHIGEKSSNWKGGISEQLYCKLWTEKFRKLIRDQYHNKCFICNKSKEDNQNRNLSVHHVNYNKNCLCQKTCEFIPLCQSCHSKTNGNRSYWEDLIMCYLYPERYFMVEI